ncbi:MAG: serine/threonine protein kinase [endosymbiont of Galathealinum brachiosum]|uniref:Stress response kinase A n=1 Tax=endosymbiont of Galathealinum brachiosum TaxID=2200906 RepID=A0A370DB99_9GAMM|nr:MAG: serine/threonine protein kinase [endosymbiont of Galathealinum brachiosum]
MESQPPTHDFAALDPTLIIDSVESLGLQSDARIFALNSYENRVYQIGLEEGSDFGQKIIGKYYRPNRWSNEQIQEEHDFTTELSDLEIPVVAPLQFNQQSLLNYNNFRFALFRQKGGRTAELDNTEHLEWIGRFLGRIHLAGASKPFKYRPQISVQDYAIDSARFLLDNNFIPDYLLEAYQTLSNDLIGLLEQRFQSDSISSIRLHGDCHQGNILWTDQGPHFVDFDDCRSGPAVQDIWMLLSGDTQEQQKQLNHVLDGYFEFAELEPAELRLVEPLRSLRLMHYASWLAKRWSDPSFPMNFPWFNTPNYWEQHILELREQFALLQESENLHL